VLAESAKPVQSVHFRVDCAEALAERLAGQGEIAVTTPLGPTHWGTRWIRVRDPDGREFALEEIGDWPSPTGGTPAKLPSRRCSPQGG
jgi:uncharacterized glyoxalase superfamily protein PhnB